MLTSKYTNKPVNWQHVVIEKLCVNKAKAERKLPLPPYFWRLKEWSQYWAYQSKLLQPIIKHVDWISISKAIDITGTFSLNNPKFKRVCWNTFLASKKQMTAEELDVKKDQTFGGFEKTETGLDLL